MTPKHRERIVNLIDSLEDYRLNAEFKRNDIEISEWNAIDTLRRRLERRLEDSVIEDD